MKISLATYVFYAKDMIENFWKLVKKGVSNMQKLGIVG